MTDLSNNAFHAARRAVVIDRDEELAKLGNRQDQLEAKMRLSEAELSQLVGRVNEISAHLGFKALRSASDSLPGSLRAGERSHA